MRKRGGANPRNALNAAKKRPLKKRHPEFEFS
jgi:hypothetical protein